MKAISTVFLSIACFAASAQSDIDYPYNPDADGNGFIGVSDILQSLSVYDDLFIPTEIMIDDSVPLSQWVPIAVSELQNLESTLDSIQDLQSGQPVFTGQSICMLNHYTTYTWPNPLVFHLPDSCETGALFMRPTSTQVILPDSSMSRTQSITFAVHRDPFNGAGSISFLAKDGLGELETIASYSASAEQYGGCDPSPCVTNYQAWSQAIFRFTYFDDSWLVNTTNVLNVSPTE